MIVLVIQGTTTINKQLVLNALMNVSLVPITLLVLIVQLKERKVGQPVYVVMDILMME